MWIMILWPQIPRWPKRSFHRKRGADLCFWWLQRLIWLLRHALILPRHPKARNLFGHHSNLLRSFSQPLLNPFQYLDDDAYE